MNYDLPIAEVEFLLFEVLDLEGVLNLPGGADCDHETFIAIAKTFGVFAKQELLPLNQVGDVQGASLDNGQVHAPPGYASAYQAFCSDGWNGLPLEREHGGQQLPFTLHAVMREAMASTNLSFALIHELNFGVYEAVLAHGTEEMKELYLPRLVDGTWAGTMCLTESHCGTDLGLIRTKAKTNSDGSYNIEGEKIFITWGDHEMSDNIVHLVLARIEGADKGVRGLSLFLVPKILPDTRQRNRITIVGLEDKMGIHGSPTCSISFEGAKGWLVGEPGKGLVAMFVMMNAARLSVGLQGLGVAEVSFQVASAYVHERLQGRGPGERTDPATPADPLIVHPDVRRRLLIMKAELDAARAMAYHGALLLDHVHRNPDPEARKKAHARVSVLTPVLKSYISDLGSRHANEALQLHGGHGYIRDLGVEQLIRDVRITEIYEGTNAIQAIDLVTRKLGLAEGSAIESFIEEIRQESHLSSEIDELKQMADSLGRACEAFEKITHVVLNSDQETKLTVACDYLDMVALCLSGCMSLRTARTALTSDTSLARQFRDEKYQLAKVFFDRILPRRFLYERSIYAGSVTGYPVVLRS